MFWWGFEAMSPFSSIRLYGRLVSQSSLFDDVIILEFAISVVNVLEFAYTNLVAILEFAK